MKKLLFSLVIILSSVSYSQESVDLANVYFRTSPANSFDNPFGEKRHFNMYVVDAKLPIVLNDKNIFILGLEYNHQTITTYPNPFGVYLDYTMSSSMLQLGLEHKWNNKSKMLFMAIPRYNTDFNKTTNTPFQLGGLALGTTKRSENFEWKYGAYYNGEFFGPMLVPLFGFNWKINDQMRFKLVIPLNFEYSYQPKSWFRTGVRFEGVNGSYQAQLVDGQNWSDYYMDRADNNVWAFTEFHIGKNVWFHLKAGHSVLRKYRRFSPDDKMSLKLGPVNIGDSRNFDNPKDIPSLIDNGYSFEARFIYRLPLDK